MNNELELREFITTTIKQWVGRNFGSQELDDPSWNIEALARCISKELAGKVPFPKQKKYELTVLYDPECDLEQAKVKVENIISAGGGKVVKVEDDGKKRVPYAIRGHDFAQYIYYDITLPDNGSPAQISSTLNITDEVLRYLMVQADVRRR